MVHFKTLAISSYLFLFFAVSAHAAEFLIINKCPQTIWAASTPVGGGKELAPGASWTITAPPGTKSARIWGRTGCTRNGPNGLSCQTGDCGGVLQCTGYGKAPNTLAEYGLNGYANQDFIDISLVQGFNLPMKFMSNSPKCSTVRTCNGPVIAQCPAALKVPLGCTDPCTALHDPKYCCPPPVTTANCRPTEYSEYFKRQCPDAYSYPKDDPSSLKTCPSGTNYKVVFCPQ